MAMGGLTWGLLCLYLEFYMASAITLVNYVFWKKAGKFGVVKFVQVASRSLGWYKSTDN